MFSDLMGAPLLRLQVLEKKNNIQTVKHSRRDFNRKPLGKNQGIKSQKKKITFRFWIEHYQYRMGRYR